MKLLPTLAAGAAATALLAVVAGCSVNAGVSATAGPMGPCTPNDSLSCVQGADGWTCPASYNPETQQGGLSCSVASPDGPNDDFCCFDWTYGSTCTPDDTLLCARGSYGYVCDQGDNPSSLDSTLNCSDPTPDGPKEDYCCQ